MRTNAYDIVRDFEKVVADYCGSPYAVAVNSCTNALLLSCEYLSVKEVTIPNRTYPSVPCSIIHAGGKVKFKDKSWVGGYRLDPYPIFDYAHLFSRDMCCSLGTMFKYYVCISFNYNKPVSIGSGGMILTDDEESVDWFKRMRYVGRGEMPLNMDWFTHVGYNMYMTPEQAAKGLRLMMDVKDVNVPHATELDYPDLSQNKIYTSDDV